MRGEAEQDDVDRVLDGPDDIVERPDELDDVRLDLDPDGAYGLPAAVLHARARLEHQRRSLVDAELEAPDSPRRADRGVAGEA